MKTAPISIERLKEVVSYDMTSGEFTWIGRGRGIRTGRQAGSVEPNGYRVIRIDGADHYAHRLAWFWVNGKFPRLIRFQNGDKDDCRIDNLREVFYVRTKHDHKTKTGRSEYAKEWRNNFPDKYKDKALQGDFGIGLAEYAAMVASQGNKCAICDHPETQTRNGKAKALAVDHDHATGKIRGLLCSDCNQAIGKLKEDRDVLLSAIRYLDRHSGASPNVLHLEIGRRN